MNPYQRPKGLSAIPPSAFQHGHLLPRPTRTAAMMIPASLPLLDGSEEGRAVLAEVRGSSRECWLFDTKCLGLCSAHTDRKSTRLNSSHVAISYAVFCL